jgi:hypothetical protein
MVYYLIDLNVESTMWNPRRIGNCIRKQLDTSFVN